MASQKRILNVTNGHHMKPHAAERAVDCCSHAWVEQGISVRTLNLSESMNARRVQAIEAEPLPYAELFGIKYDPCANGLAASKAEADLIWEAQKFVAKENAVPK